MWLSESLVVELLNERSGPGTWESGTCDRPGRKGYQSLLARTHCLRDYSRNCLRLYLHVFWIGSDVGDEPFILIDVVNKRDFQQEKERQWYSQVSRKFDENQKPSAVRPYRFPRTSARGELTTWAGSTRSWARYGGKSGNGANIWGDAGDVMPCTVISGTDRFKVLQTFRSLGLVELIYGVGLMISPDRQSSRTFWKLLEDFRSIYLLAKTAKNRQRVVRQEQARDANMTVSEWLPEQKEPKWHQEMRQWHGWTVVPDPSDQLISARAQARFSSVFLCFPPKLAFLFSKKRTKKRKNKEDIHGKSILSSL